MPALPRIPNPEEGPLQAFAYDLRRLGEGKVSISWIAEHHETRVSRAALYAALSGTRLPSEATLSTLLRWWVGKPAEEVEIDDDFGHRLRGDWDWQEKLPVGHEAHPVVAKWVGRYSRVFRELARIRAPKADPVTIEVPEEQRRFIGELDRLLKTTGLDDELWLILGSGTRAVEGYLAGQAIPTEKSCWRLVVRLEAFFPEGTDTDDVFLRLWNAADFARAGRARARRLARSGATR
ncbi:hypothetical protein ACFXPW_25340 [Streptomyces goshikiensis]|uniref:hypothetical protein n=1 Tax=Streptomyces goshikiensis TaxID=1942 RepID=UPI0036B1DA89